MGLYASFEQVRLRLVGKVQFTDDANDDNRMQSSLAKLLIDEAEGEVEQDLSPRYAAPFQTDAGLPFTKLPTRPTQQIIKTLAELKSCMRILETDFGTGSVMDSSKYSEALQKRYDAILEKLLAKKKEGLGWMYPPLPNLMLNYQNSEADDGYAGMIHVTSAGYGDYPEGQINNPAQTYWNGTLDSIDRDPA